MGDFDVGPRVKDDQRYWSDKYLYGGMKLCLPSATRGEMASPSPAKTKLEKDYEPRVIMRINLKSRKVHHL